MLALTIINDKNKDNVTMVIIHKASSLLCHNLRSTDHGRGGGGADLNHIQIWNIDLVINILN